jgi:hypothetical protein
MINTLGKLKGEERQPAAQRLVPRSREMDRSMI